MDPRLHSGGVEAGCSGRRLSVTVGTTLADAEARAAAEVARTQEAAEPIDRASGLLVVETGGTMMRYLDGWHEVKVGLVAGWEDGQLQHPSFVAAREPAETFGRHLLGEGARRGGQEIVAGPAESAGAGWRSSVRR